MPKSPKLDAATVEVIKRVLALPPKHHDEMKVGRPPRKKKRGRSKKAAA
jgi:hypothetical protein